MMERANDKSRDTYDANLDDLVNKPHFENMQSKLLPEDNYLCCGKPEKRLRVLIIIIATAVLVISAIAAAWSVIITPGSCSAGFCDAYAHVVTEVLTLPGGAPSFLRFSQRSTESWACETPRAFVVGGLFKNGWAERWDLETTVDPPKLVSSTDVLVSNKSGELNWPHSIVQDPCSGTLFIANANDNQISMLTCKDVQVDNSFDFFCQHYNDLQNFTSFFNPLGLHQVNSCLPCIVWISYCRVCWIILMSNF